MTIDNIRVQVEKKYHGIYRELTTETVRHPKIFEQHGDLFMLCVCCGYVKGVPTDFKGGDLFWSHSLNKHQETVLRAMAMRKIEDRELFSNPQHIIALAEQYANTGVEYLVNNVISEYVKTDGSDMSLDFSSADQLEKILCSFIQDEITNGILL